MRPARAAFIPGTAFAVSAQVRDRQALAPQHGRMAECSANAKGLEGDEDRKARHGCLRA
ncbi:MAG: hypothetical protein FJY55_02420 [Betaproteobacteria bacterium]|nr:hypothetical protein [Betaproteobacteria bacterium]